jgi:hypothetical protein
MGRLPDAAADLAGRLRRINWYWAAALVLAGAAAWPLWSQPGLVNTRGGGDSPFLLQRLQQLTAALADGHFPVRWMPDANYGYGYPFFNYYAPLSIYIAAGFRFLGFGLVGAVKLAQLAGFVTAAGAMFALGRRWLGSPRAGVLASAAYTLAPFHLVNVYVRGDSLAEFWAMAFFPLVLLAADSLVRSGAGQSRCARGPVVALALAFAGLILSHNISALIFTPFLLLYLGLALWHRRQEKRLWLTAARAALALGLGLVLSAWFWLPALAEQSLARLEPVTSGYFHYSNHFRGAGLVQGGLLFDYDVAGGRAFAMGLAQAVLVGGGLVAVVVWLRRGETGRRTGRAGALFAVAGLLAATFMITPLSRPLWDALPLLPFTQFPWRFLSVQALAGALATGALGRHRWWTPAALVLLLVSGLGGLKVDHLPLVDGDVTARRLAEYEWFTGNIGSTVSAEYLPQSVEARPFTSPWLNEGRRERLLAAAGELVSGRLELRQSTRQVWQVEAGPAGDRVVFPALYWSGWQASIDGQEASTEPAPGSGLIWLEIEPGRHQVTLELRRTPVRLLAEGLSLGGLIALGGLVAAGRPIPSRPRRPHLAWGLVAAAALIVLALVGRLWPEPATGQDLQSWDFAQLGYLHQAQAAIRFEDGGLMAGYAYDRQEVEAGERVTVTIRWDVPPRGPVTLALGTPALTRYDDAPLLASQGQEPAAEMRFDLDLPENSPPGLYLPRLTVAGAQALTPQGQTRGDLFLRPLLVTAGAPAGESTAREGLDVRAVAVWHEAGLPLHIQLQWWTGRVLSENLAVSLRLLDDQGNWLAQLDTQPGYGFQPSSGWPAGQWIDDWLNLPLPEELRPGDADQSLALVASLYDPGSLAPVLTRRLGVLTWQGEALHFQERAREATTLPDDLVPVPAVFGEAVRLHGYRLSREGPLLNVTLYWEALVPLEADYWHFVHLTPAGGEEVVVQHDSMPQQNSYPTSQWTAGEIVADGLRLDLGQAPPGSYWLSVGLYEHLGGTLPRLAVVDDGGQALPGGRLVLPETITVDSEG